jgi:hypothetical protein
MYQILLCEHVLFLRFGCDPTLLDKLVFDKLSRSESYHLPRVDYTYRMYVVFESCFKSRSRLFQDSTENRAQNPTDGSICWDILDPWCRSLHQPAGKFLE